MRDSGSSSLLSVFRSKQGGQLLRGKIFELASLLFQAGLEPQGELMQLGRINSPGELGQLERTQVAQALPLPIELQFHHQDGLLKFGMGLGGAAENERLIAPGQTVLVIAGVQAKADQGGSNPARAGERLRQRKEMEAWPRSSRLRHGRWLRCTAPDRRPCGRWRRASASPAARTSGPRRGSSAHS